jgi:molybdate transport system ATP-binding protein
MELTLQREQFNLSVNTELPDMGFSAIYGRSGAGKTTLLRWLAGLEENTHGQLHFKQQCWQDANSFVPTQQRRIAYVFQESRLFPHLNVQGNLMYAYKRRFNNDGPSVQQVCQWFELETLINQNIPHLSGGQQQRVAMARALLSSPQLVLMDEPLGSLDSRSKEYILRHLEQLHRRLNIPVIYISHDIEEVSRLADHLLLLENGRVSAQGPLLELSTRLDLSLSHEENAASIIEATVQQHDKHYHLTELMIGAEASLPQPLFLTKNNNQPGDKVRVRVPARDVSIALEKPKNSSILNILSCTVEAIESTNEARVLVRLKLAEQGLLARLTHKSIDRLNLQIGQTVYAQIKTVALLNDQIDPSQQLSQEA